MTSLRTRIVWSYGVLIVLVIVMLGTMFAALVWNYYYSSAVGSVLQRAETEAALHNRNIAYLPMKDKASYMLQNMTNGISKLELLDNTGKIVVDSDGLPGNGTALATPDVLKGIDGEKGVWRGLDPLTHERIAAVTLPVKQEQRVVAMFRYTASLQQVDDIIRNMLWIGVLVGVVVVLLFFTMSIWIANRIARPIRNLTRVAEQMAEGEWTKRADIRDRDEIGRLSETLNTMASELTRREKLKEDFISSISHELRTPLTSIKGWSETLASGDPADIEEMQMGLAIIDRETDRLSGLVEDLLDFSKLYAKSIVLHPEMLDLIKPMRETLKQFEARAQKESIRIIGNYGHPTLPVEADANRLKQVFINVLDNALKFTPKGGSITVAADQEGDWVRVSVMDTGSGISPEDLPHVTEKFYKGSSQRSGSGLGLAICKEIVELHGGTFRLDSAMGEGTTVTIRLPLKKIEEIGQSIE
ncbi:sensor histidine kinase [Paenibacillus baekrokdamisoli]|uniref:histidine kinase n=1 Tax=Paenibacillus baekrokdamisoli TaxID=1712516 RepID=A0A3G9JHX7_9BACL|nr:HAMP domain-containing sensor histidine kinase [Paenibacillus baekrokdamisoli]MBB3068324.1 signal transduction histidine kinase [Paenibacillus baekrokdamisoli]BBH22634.1 sensor histidine kinase [Paenibacillus baekrokdamisoli]